MLLHAANAALLFAALNALSGALWRSATVAALFALHPRHVESVAWVAERKDVLSTFFWMLCLASYAWYARSPSLARFVPVVLSLALGLMAKPMLVTLPFVLLLLDYWPLERWRERFEVGGIAHAWIRLLAEKVPLLVLAGGSCVLTLLAQEGAIVSSAALPVDVRIAHAMVAYWRYLGMAVWPTDLSVYYPLEPDTSLAWRAALAAVMLAGVTMAASLARMRHPYLLVGWLWYVGTLVPVIGLVQVGTQAVADRYLYVPLIGIFVMAVWGAAELCMAYRWLVRPVACAAAICLAACAVLTIKGLSSWRNSAALWTQALAVDPANAKAHYFLGCHWNEAGRPRDGWRHLQIAVELQPNDIHAQYNLGLAYQELGHPAEAARHLEQAIRLSSRSARLRIAPHLALGRLLIAQQQPAAALPYLHEAIQQAPGNSEAHNLLGVAHAGLGELDQAIACYGAAIREDPTSARYYNNLGAAHFRCGAYLPAAQACAQAVALEVNYAPAYNNLLLAQHGLGQLREAVTAGVKAVTLAPANLAFRANLAYVLHQAGEVDRARALYQEIRRRDPNWMVSTHKLAWKLATSKQSQTKTSDDAVRLAEQVHQALADDDAQALDVLAAAYARAGRFPEAVASARKALALAGPAERSGPIGERLRLYEQGQPFLVAAARP